MGNMANNHIEHRLQKIIEKTLELRKLWEQRRLQAERQIEVLDAKLAAYQITLKDYWESVDKDKTSKRKKAHYEK